MYQILYQLPYSKDTKARMLRMDSEQQELYDIIIKSKIAN